MDSRRHTRAAAITPTSMGGKQKATPAVPASRKSSNSAKKRKAAIHAECDDEEKPNSKRKMKQSDEEKRLRRHRAQPPGTYIERLDRVRTQRMFLIDRNRTNEEFEEVFDIAGSTGNIYQVTINKIPSCTCPDAKKGNQCKHIIYVMVNVLKARDDLAYQLALLSTELAEIFENAPHTPQSSDSEASGVTDTGCSRKSVEGDCPVCVMQFEEDEDIIWCKAACGNNIHRQCFEQWAKSKAGQVKCVFCRTPWKGDEDSVKRIARTSDGVLNEEGYINVAGQLGLSTRRDMSSYHPYWVMRQQYGRHGDYGYDDEDVY
ncbi:hypothetical protein B0O99DRAFT_680297 [Bisporella sp. PMI_857]|nr:hypothetical protein B0O99DRAFT_680297 [Bisporella sp. PMI_857]